MIPSSRFSIRAVHGLADHAISAPPTRLPYRVRTLGRNRRNRYHATLGTHHEDAMLTLVVSGKGSYLQGENVTEVSAGQVVLVLPDPDVGILMADPEDPYDHFYVRFAGNQALEAARRIRVAEGAGSSVFFWQGWQEGAALMARMCVQPACRPLTPERMTPIDAMLAELLARMDNELADPSREITSASLRSYLMEHLARPSQLDAMADYFGVSKPHLCRRAKALLGDTLVHTWERLKMDWACILLAESHLNISEVARRVGYEDAFYFSKVFKAHSGLSPRAWKNRRIGQNDRRE